jgi:fluoride ion exporter CrcB/FEX
VKDAALLATLTMQLWVNQRDRKIFPGRCGGFTTINTTDLGFSHHLDARAYFLNTVAVNPSACQHGVAKLQHQTDVEIELAVG